MSKKLLFISAAFNCGAPGKIVEHIGLMAMMQGWDVYAIHGSRHANPSELRSLGVTSSFGEYSHALISGAFDAQGLGSILFTLSFVKRIRALKPDIIHLHNIHGYYICYPILFRFLKSINTPIVWTIHDFWPITGHCVHFDYFKCEKWKRGCGRCDFHNTYPFSLTDFSARNYRLKKECFQGLSNLTIVPVSNWVSSVLQESFLNDYPVHVIYNGVDLRTFAYKESNYKQILGIDEKAHVLLGVASPWSTLKGMSDYFALSERLPDDYVIVMVGLTRKQISTLPRGIIGIERISDQEELSRVYSISDIVLNLSYQETFGMTTVEGFACGKPSIVYDRTASPELVTNETGRIVKAGDINGIVSAINDIIRIGGSYFADKCRRRAECMFDTNKCYQNYIDLYERLLNDTL